ncbi:MAG: hypothetical protein NC926_01120 [Candidatus Omnitrophica bacterium]|nr:hypothetical protein [Candidatus Omnitrophota bacterium]MCM8806551.1 hypothetical protein [Candidatus Omnitrophota bacterium]
MFKKIFLFLFIFSIFVFSKEGRKDNYEKFYEEIKKIFSLNPEEVVKGIYNIGEKKIEKGVPILLKFLNDTSIVYLQYNSDGKWTRIDKEAEEAIVKIGEKSLGYIYDLLNEKYPYVEIDEKIEIKIISIVSKITGKNFENIEECFEYLEKIK